MIIHSSNRFLKKSIENRQPPVPIGSSWSGGAARQYPHLVCPPTFQPETYSLARPPTFQPETYSLARPPPPDA